MARARRGRRRSDRSRCCGSRSSPSIAVVIALIGWLPSCSPRVDGSPAGTGTAQHYLPADGALLTFPMLQFTLLGALCMLGTLWLVVRARSSTRARRAGDRRAGGLPVVAAVDADHAGRHHAAVVPAAADADRAAGRGGRVRVRRGDAGVSRRYQAPTSHARIVAAAAVHRARSAPWRSARTSPTCSSPTSTSPTPTPTATASARDRRPPGAEKYYAEIDATIQRGHRAAPQRDRRADRRLQLPVVLPVLGFQGLTSHYANPLGAVRQTGRRDRELGRREDRRRSSSRRWTRCRGSRPRCS